MSKIGIIADIHSNLEALTMALGILQKERIDQIIVCGDIVGYGRSPNECCDRIRTLNCPVVAGNHDWAVADLTEYQTTHSSRAVEGINYTKAIISEENLYWLQSLPLQYEENHMEFVHASFVKADKWHYLTHRSSFLDTDWHDISGNFAVLRGDIGFVGHSHRPTIFLEKRRKKIKAIQPQKEFYELQRRRAIIDVGSVGLPRGPFKRANLVIYDSTNQVVHFKHFDLFDTSNPSKATAKKKESATKSVKQMIRRWFRKNSAPTSNR